MFQFVTPISYWILTVLWLLILGLYLVNLRKLKAVDGAVALLLTILSIDAFRTLFESAYFGLYFNSWFGILPKSIYEVLSQPEFVIIPKVINVAAGFIVLFLLIRRWVPREIEEREKLVEDLQAAVVESSEKETMLNAILDGITDGIIFADTERRIVAVNRGMKKTFGYTRSDLVGKKTSVLYEKDEEYERQGRIHFNHSVEDSPTPYEVNYQRKNGDVFIGETLSAVIRDTGGTIQGFIGVIRDVTDRKHTDAALLKAKDDAEKANLAKSQFLASMSHELRTPMNAVLGFAQMLQFDPANPLTANQNDHVENILTGGYHLLELVNEVLDLAKIEADQLSFSVETLDASDIISDCVNLTTPLGKQRNITLVNDFPDDQISQIQTDHIRFRQVLLNLLSNAVKYNKDGGTVTIDGYQTDDGYLHISITDTGVGISAKDFGGLFQMFHRLGADPMKTKEGTGIGLTVSKLLVEKMAGRIGVESTEGIGSAFWIEIPMASKEDIIIWSDDLRSGVDAIDKDHQVLITLLNKMVDRTIPKEEIHDVIGELIDHTSYHFKREEAIMEVCQSSNLEQHRELHRDLLNEMSTMTAAWNRDDSYEKRAKLQKFLHDWLLDHILNEDSKLASDTKGMASEIQQALDEIK